MAATLRSIRRGKAGNPGKERDPMHWRYVWLRMMAPAARWGQARWGTVLLGVALAIVVAVMTLTCSRSVEPGLSGDPCSPDYPAHYTVIGPQGGETGVGYSTTPGDMVRLLVPAGAWAECWEVQVNGDFGWTTPAYPTGFIPGQYATLGSIAISIYRRTPAGDTIYAPDSMYVELSFPLLKIPPDSQLFLAAIHYDGTARDWRVILPDAIDTNFLTVHVTNWKQPWWFGRLDPARIDFNRYVAPALADRIGTDAWSNIQTVMDSINNAAVPYMQNNCAGVNAIQAIFEGFMNHGAAGVQAIQAGINCGTCDALTAIFWNDWWEYVHRLQVVNLIDFLTNLIPEGKWPLELGGYAITFALQQWAKSGFACDYECYFNSISLTWYLYMAEYAVGGAIAGLIDVYKTNTLGCQL
jgi:hypothetical protein